MTKKDYNEFATLFGRWMKDLPEHFISEFCDILALDNANFSWDRFNLWMIEVSEKKRDQITGKRKK